MFRRHARNISNKTAHSGHSDRSLWVIIILLVIFGLIMVYDASVIQASSDFGDKYYYIKQQLIWVLLGFIAIGFFSKLDYHFLKLLALPFFLLSLVLLFGVFIPGLQVESGGAHRWLNLGFVTIQPAEIIKLSTIIFFAALFEKKFSLAPFIIIAFSVSAIIGVFQKDLGSAIVYFLTCAAMYVVMGAPLKYFWSLIPIAGLIFTIFAFSSEYRKNRIMAFLDPFSDPQGYSYHISQVLIALGSGGIFGLGLGQSRQKYEYIPEVTTDSIFSIVGEELGLLGALFLIGLFSFLVLRGLKIAEGASDNFGKILAAGLTCWLGIQAVVNLAAMVSLIPLTGVPLPFISYGGSALLANLVAVGILLNISKRAKLD